MAASNQAQHATDIKAAGALLVSRVNAAVADNLEVELSIRINRAPGSPNEPPADLGFFKVSEVHGAFGDATES